MKTGPPLEERFRDLLESIPVAIVLTNSAGGIVFANTCVATLFGYAPGELVDKAADILLAERHRGAGAFAFGSAQFTADANVNGRRSDGSEFPIEISASPLQFGQATLLSAAIRDVTQHKRFERELHEKNVELESVNKELEAFDYSVAHDLRAPLNRIEGFVAMLKDQYGGNLDAHGQELLRRIEAAGRSMDQLVGDLLKLSTTSHGTLSRDSIDLTALAESIVAGLRRSEPQREVRVVALAGMSARADPGLLRVVMENLIGNAWKYTRQRVPARIEIGCIDNSGERVFFVRDNGVGFDPHGAEDLFKPFRRSHAENEFEGSGIGLATVRRIVRRHGGRVWAEGVVGNGAAFFFTLSARVFGD